MRVFVTGATGFVGGAVAEAFRRRGHRVAGLTRTAAKGRALAAREIEPALGDMKDPRSYELAARTADVLVHCAAEYTSDYQTLDRRTIDAFVELTKGSRTRTIIYTSGVWQYGSTGAEPVDESSAFEGKPLAPWRSEHEKLVLAAGGARDPARLLVRALGRTHGRVVRGRDGQGRGAYRRKRGKPVGDRPCG